MNYYPVFMSFFCLNHSFVYLLYFCSNWDRSSDRSKINKQGYDLARKGYGSGVYDTKSFKKSHMSSFL